MNPRRSAVGCKSMLEPLWAMIWRTWCAVRDYSGATSFSSAREAAATRKDKAIQPSREKRNVVDTVS